MSVRVTNAELLEELEDAEVQISRVWNRLYERDPNISLESSTGKAEDIIRRIRALKLSLRESEPPVRIR